MLEAVIFPLAKQDVKDATEWYELKKKGLGRRFAQEVRTKVSFVCENPYSTSVRYDDVRCAVLDVFPFMIHYIIQKSRKQLVIVAVFHTSLSPKQWGKR